ncbi:6-carboxytetrahydropterin synthase QueD [bacterium]|nr:6-carboxytetrahydropterin synthase QueD [bacterium]
MFEVKVEKSFSAAHHLLNYQGACENQHGHNWKVEVYVKGETLDKSNILVDFKVLKKELDEILDYLDHKDINTLPEFLNESPSSEFMAKFIYEKMKARLKNQYKNVKVSKVAVWETPTSRATYFEE